MGIFGRAFICAAFALTVLLIGSPGAVAQTKVTPSDPYANATLWTLTGDYAHFFQSSGSGIDYAGVAGSLKWSFDTDLALHFEGGYHHVTFAGGDANDVTAGASLVFERQYWHFGPALGLQSSIQKNSTTSTFNYGGFAQFYASSSLALSGWGGGFRTDAYDWNGLYLSGSAEWYPVPDFAITGQVNFTDVPGGSFPFRETDLVAGIEWKPIADTPVSFYAAYAYSDFSTHDHANTIYFALKFYGGAGERGATAPLIVQRYESIDVSPIAQGLVFKY
jgi:hypothetical protein